MMKIFEVNSSTITNRIDPMPYHPERTKEINKILKGNFKSKPLRKIAKISQSIISSNDKNLPYIGLENIQSQTGILRYNDKKTIFANAVKFNMGQILFPRLRPNLNKVYYADFEGIASTEFYVLTPKNILGKYLFYFLQSNTIVNQTSHLITGNTLPRLQTNDVMDLFISIPPKTIQESIVKIMDEAYKKQYELEKKSENIIRNIDLYIAEKLGFVWKEFEKKKYFLIPSRTLKKQRIDPQFNHPWHLDWLNSFKKGFYPLLSLNNISEVIFQGIQQIATNKNEFVFLKVKNIKKNNFIDFDNIEYTKKAPLLKILKKGDIISPYVGEAIRKIKFAVYYNDRIPSTIDNNIGVIRVKKSIVDPDYINSFLCSKLGKLQLIKLIGGGGIPFLGSYNASKIKISIPPLKIQKQIAEEIRKLEKESEKLKKQEIEIIAKAKNEVEKILFN